MILIKPISGLIECQSWPSTVSQAGPEKCIKAEWFPYIDAHRQVVECVRNAKRGEKHKFSVNVSLRGRGQKIWLTKRDKKRFYEIKIDLDNSVL